MGKVTVEVVVVTAPSFMGLLHRAAGWIGCSHRNDALGEQRRQFNVILQLGWAGEVGGHFET